jgi:hypothetical protein
MVLYPGFRQASTLGYPLSRVPRLFRIGRKQTYGPPTIERRSIP